MHALATFGIFLRLEVSQHALVHRTPGFPVVIAAIEAADGHAHIHTIDIELVRNDVMHHHPTPSRDPLLMCRMLGESVHLVTVLPAVIGAEHNPGVHAYPQSLRPLGTTGLDPPDTRQVDLPFRCKFDSLI